ncbi:MAG: EamA family transporter [Alphaproteobacteria bacterium]|nr:EamA family transporter [Alphaproteobacteria bacterium]
MSDGGRMRPVDTGLGAMATLVWAGAFIVTDAALQHTAPIAFAAMRFVISAAFVLVVPRPAVGWRPLLAIGLLLGVGQHAGIFLGMALGVPPGMAALLAHTQSFFTLAMAWALIGERLTPRKVAAFTLALAGLGLLMAERGTPMPLLAMLSVLAASISAATGNLILRRLGGADPVGIAAWMSAVAAPGLVALSMIVEGPGPVIAIATQWNTTLVLAGLYSGVLSGLGAYTIWARLFGRYEAHRVAPFMLLVPVGAIVLSVAWFGERLTPWRAAAALAILAGLALNLVPSRRSAR